MNGIHDLGGMDGFGPVEADYYEQWLRALESLLVDEGLVAEGELADRVREFETGARDASEFVVGDHGHGHGHSHDHPHDHGHSHDHEPGHDH